MARPPLTRRTLLLDAGRATIGALVLGLAACSDADDAGAGGTPTGGSQPTSDPADPATTAPEAGPSSPDAGPTATEGPDVFAGGWRRVGLGSVAAYVVVRDGEATLVDTGVGGSEGEIERVLTAAGGSWSSLAHVVMTHRHPDHAGSIAAVMDRATTATAYIGSGDVEAIRSIVDVTAVDDGDRIAGLRVLGTPGHTPGHIALIDDVAGVLLPGDALLGPDSPGGPLEGPPARFTEDLDLAIDSVRSLVGLDFDTVLMGHGQPLAGGGAAAVSDLADALES